MKAKLPSSDRYLYLPGARMLSAQELGPHFKKVGEGIYVYAAVLNEATRPSF